LQPSVLIVAEDAEFARAIMTRWQTERSVPAFILIGAQVWKGAGSSVLDLAIVGPLRGSTVHSALRILESTDKPVVCVCEDSKAFQTVREKMPRMLPLRQNEDWLDSLMLVSGEALRRTEALKRAAQAENASALDSHHATLGRYMLEMRHSLNNALTSVLGNSELLLLEPGALSAPVREQIDVIRNMALRMHEIIQRFSSLDTEMKATAGHAVAERVNGSKAFAAGAH
jgi:signal transduction histidine kinase